MLRAMVFIDFENFDIAKFNYYKEKCLLEAQEEAKNNGTTIPTSVQTVTPKLDFNKIPKEIVNQLSIPHILVKTFLFAPKPDQFLMQDSRRSSTYNWINGLKNQDFFTVVEGTHSARPVSGFTYKTMSLSNPASYYVEEKGTDVNLAAHVISKGLHSRPVHRRSRWCAAWSSRLPRRRSSHSCSEAHRDPMCRCNPDWRPRLWGSLRNRTQRFLRQSRQQRP